MQLKYSGDLKSRHVQIWNGEKEVGLQKVQILKWIWNLEAQPFDYRQMAAILSKMKSVQCVLFIVLPTRSNCINNHVHFNFSLEKSGIAGTETEKEEGDEKKDKKEDEDMEV